MKLLHIYNKLVPLTSFFSLRAQGATIKDASACVAMGSTYNDQTIASWARDFISPSPSLFKFSRFRMGGNRSVRSIMWDERIRARATVWLRLNSGKRKGKPCMKNKDFRQYLQTDLLQNTGRVISKWFSRTFLISLGWRYKKHQKSVYYDGHERPDVKEARTVFLRRMRQLERRMQKYDGDDCDIVRVPDLEPDEKELVLVVHDECSVHANDDENAQWVEEGRGHALKKKHKGDLVNISLFLSEDKGRLKLTDQEYAQYKRINPGTDLPQQAAVYMKCGAKHATAKTGKTVLGVAHNGYWTNAHVLEQVKIAVKIFEIKHPGKIGLFLFDNSTGHNAYAADALIAHHTNYRPGGKQSRMRSTLWNDKVQHMVFKSGDKVCHDVVIGDDVIHKGTVVRRSSPLHDMAKGSRQVRLSVSMTLFVRAS